MRSKAVWILTVAGFLLSAAALYFYSQAGNTTRNVRIMNIAALALCALYLLAGLIKLKLPGAGMLVTVGAVLMIAAAAYSLVSEVEVLAYLRSGLRSWEDVKFWAYFAGSALISWLFLLLASFMRLD